MFLKQTLAIFSFIFIVSLIIIGGIVLRDKSNAINNSVYIYLYKNNQLLPVTKPITSEDSKLQQSLQYLMAGPNEKEKKHKFFTLIPENLRIEKIYLDSGLVYIFLNNEVSNISGGMAQIQGFIKQIVYTCTQFPNVAAVIFTSAASKNKPLIIGGEGYTIDAPLDRNSFN